MSRKNIAPRLSNRTPQPHRRATSNGLVYQNPVLTQLIHTASVQHYDVRISAAQVLEAQAQLGIVCSNQFPSANVGASYLEVLTNDTTYFSTELNLVQAQLNERSALVQLYQALGGGWQQ